MSSSKGSINHCTVNPILEAFILELSLPRKPADGRFVAHKPERTHPHVCGGMADEPCNTGNHCAPYRAAVTNPPLHDYQVLFKLLTKTENRKLNMRQTTIHCQMTMLIVTKKETRVTMRQTIIHC